MTAHTLIIKRISQEGDLDATYSPLHNISSSDDNSLIDFTVDNDSLGVDLDHPLNVECQPSYDGTVNLIINDDKNPPRIINTRFSKIENNRYRLITRNQLNQTNIYDSDRVDQQTRLFRNLNAIPKIDLINVYNSGQLWGGNYTFYIKFADDDYNKTDIVAESSQVSVFKGYTNTPSSVSGTVFDERTDKSIMLKIRNIDTSFSRIYLYFSRETCDDQGFKVTKCGMFKEPYSITGETAYITIHGYEEIEDLTVDQLNIQYNIVTAAKTQAQVQNMLFLGNVQQTVLDVASLQNLSYYIKVKLKQGSSIGYINPADYTGKAGDDSNQLEYYNPKNIYYNLGYWPDEMYRLGVVYIMADDSLTPVFNLRGVSFDAINDVNNVIDTQALDKLPRNIITGGPNSENTMGVFKLPKASVIKKDSVEPLYFEMGFPNLTEIVQTDEGEEQEKKTVLERLKKLGVKGLFFVRQRRIQTTLCQGLSVGVDKGCYIPMLYDTNKNKYFGESFLSQESSNKGCLSKTYSTHKVYTEAAQCTGLLSLDAICNPELQSMFDGSDFVLEKQYSTAETFNEDKRHIYLNQGTGTAAVDSNSLQSGIIFVGSNTPMKYIWNKKFATKIGAAEDVSQFGFFEKQYYDASNTALIRGNYSPYLGTNMTFSPNTIFNIKVPNYSSAKLFDYFNIRGTDASSFFAISDRYSLDEIEYLISGGKSFDVYRGDCYTATVTIRLNRNFVDSEVPIYDSFMDTNTWKNNYLGYDRTRNTADENDKDEDPKGYFKMNRADINAVPLGMWVTYKCLSNYNLGLRTVDTSHSDEYALMGSPRSFYPVASMSVTSSNKVEESAFLNAGYNTTVGKRYNFIVKNVPYIKELFDNRIMFSRMQQNDAFQNSYRIFQGLDYQDIDRQYGAIVKFIPWGTDILCVFEHGVGIIPVNEKALISTNTGQSIHMYGAGVLQNQISVINPDFGSIWQESIIRTPMGVYGVDTYAKKIWRVPLGGNTMEILSDMKIQRYLNDHIKLNEDDKYPTVALKNVKTHYNNYKGDVMFTFYNTDKEESWNICYNERIGKWITRYSWTPLYSANIDNIFYSLDQNRAKLYGLVYRNNNRTWGLKNEKNTYDLYSNSSFESELTVEGYDFFTPVDFSINSVESSYIIDGEETRLSNINPGLFTDGHVIIPSYNEIFPENPSDSAECYLNGIATSFSNAVSATSAAGNYSIVLNRDINITSANFSGTSTVVLDLNGHKITIVEEPVNGNIRTKGTLIITDNSPANTGMIISSYNNMISTGSTYPGTIIIEKCTIKNTASGEASESSSRAISIFTGTFKLVNGAKLISNYCGIHVSEVTGAAAGSVIINNSIITSKNGYCLRLANGGASIEISGNNTSMWGGYYVIYNTTGSTSIVDNGYYYGYSGISIDDASLNASGGHYNYNISGTSEVTIKHKHVMDMDVNGTVTETEYTYTHMFPASMYLHTTRQNLTTYFNNILNLDFIPIYMILNVSVTMASESAFKTISNNLIPIIIKSWNGDKPEDGSVMRQQYETYLRNGFYVHGRAGIFNEIDYEDASFDNQILPTKWYDRQEPFEFEFVVNGDVGLHKIFNNLVIISNNVQPDEIEYEIIGDVFKFNKAGIYRNNKFGEDLWDTKYNKPKFLGVLKEPRLHVTDGSYKMYQTTQEFQNCRINWDFVLNTYTITLTQKCKNIEEFGRRLGNIHYKEDAWYITIDPILFREKARIDGIEDPEWSELKSARLRDKFIKIRVKYTGEDIAVITALKTMLTLSYA